MEALTLDLPPASARVASLVANVTALPGDVRRDSFGRVLTLAMRLLNLPAAAVTLFEGTNRRLAVARGPGAEEMHGELLSYPGLLDSPDEDGIIAVADLRAAGLLPVDGADGAGNLRAFAAVLLRSPDGIPRGHFCLFDTRPHGLTEDERRSLIEFAAIVADEVNLRGQSAEEFDRVGLQQVMEEGADSVGLASLDGKVNYLNEAGRKLMGLDSVEEARRTRLLDHVTREDRSFFLGTVVPTLMRVGRWEGDSRFRNFKTGATIEVNWSVFLVRSPHGGEPVGIASVARDVTGRKQAEIALRESEERFRHLVEQAGESFFVYDLTGRLIDVNQEACDSLGYPRGELLTMSVQDIDMDFDAIKGRDRWKQMVPGVAVTMTGINKRKNGTIFPYEARVGAFRSGGQRLMLALVRDITDRKRAEQAVQSTQAQLEARVRERTAELGQAIEELRRSETRFSRMTANVPGMVYQLLLHDDGTAEFPYVSEGCREMFGYEPAQMQPDACTLLDMIHPEDIDNFLDTLDLSKETRTAWAWEGRYICKDGAVRWLQGAARPEPRDDATLWDGLLLDITTRKRAEQEIRDRAQQAAAISELGQRALGGADDAALSREAAEVIVRTLGVELCNVVELPPDMDDLVIRGSAGFRENLAGMKLAAGTGSLAGYSIARNASQYTEDLRGETRFAVAPVLTEHHAVSAQSVVIRGKGQVLGSLVAIAARPRPFSREDINFMQAVANVLASAMDRTRDERALRKSEARNSAILETALDSIITIDHEDRIVEFNPAAEKTFGFSRATALGRMFSELLPPRSRGDAGDSAAGLANLAAARPAGAGGLPALGERVELPANRSDGSQITVEVAVTRIPVEGVPLFTAYLRDVTERRRAADALSQAKTEAERANRAKSEFLSRMSHELRTPLNAILGFGQLLQMQKLTSAQNDRVGHIVNAGRHLLDLINEVLDISRIEAGRVELSLEPVRMSDLVGETLDLIKPLAAQRQIQIDLAVGDSALPQQFVMADRQRLKQVLLNLLSNAVKYNSEGGRVRLEYAEGDEGRLRLRISDTGAGIPAEKINRLFVPFERLGAEQSSVQGTGLGLALSKRLVEAMGGAIGLQSKLGEGTTFWVELPHAESQMDRRTRLTLSGAPSALDTLSGTHKILYIEDNLSNLTLIEHLLADHTEINLMTAMQGGLGYDLARQHLPDLILLDLHLPDIPGWEVLARLKGDETTRHIPVVAVSADATPRQVEKLRQGGAHAYLTKPLDVDRFHEMLRDVLQPANGAVLATADSSAKP